MVQRPRWLQHDRSSEGERVHHHGGSKDERRDVHPFGVPPRLVGCEVLRARNRRIEQESGYDPGWLRGVLRPQTVISSLSAAAPGFGLAPLFYWNSIPIGIN